ncbi:MAG: nicotinate-nucleotide adenylyltransferase [Gammaproteobacteria bacterium]
MIGIFGGTFDPVHFGHLRPALEVMQMLRLREVRLLPCGQPPHRHAPFASGPDRLAMLRLAVDGQAGFVVDDRELRRAGPSYMVDTLASLKQGCDESLCLLLGLDAFALLPSWHRWQDILALSHIVVMQRPGMTRALLSQDDVWRQTLPQVEVDSVEALNEHAAGKVYFQEVTALDISATAIRQALQRGESVRYLLPDPVYHYLQQRHLYV